jgi:hypothetical protein
MRIKVNEKLTTFTPSYLCDHELGRFLESVLERMEPLDSEHKLYLLAGLVEQAHQIGLNSGVDKALQRIALVIKDGIPLPKEQFFD